VPSLPENSARSGGTRWQRPWAVPADAVAEAGARFPLVFVGYLGANIVSGLHFRRDLAINYTELRLLHPVRLVRGHRQGLWAREGAGISRPLR
jgi:hypothetical protein